MSKALNVWCKGMAQPDGSFSGCGCDCPACEARVRTLQQVDANLVLIHKAVKRGRVDGRGEDGAMMACIEVLLLEARKWIKEGAPARQELTEKERAKGRSEGYHDLSPSDQWAEDKRLGILDWDGS